MFVVASLVYLTASAPSKFARGADVAGLGFHEVLAVSEALYLCEHQWIDVILIGADIEDQDFAEAQLHCLTIPLDGRTHSEAAGGRLSLDFSCLDHDVQRGRLPHLVTVI